MRPEVGLSKPFKCWISVDLPLPVWPMMPKKFAAIDRERHILYRTAAKGRTLAVGVRQVFYTNDLFQGYSPLR